jgi:thiamine-phosphate pyrophosphorylase
MRFPTGNEPLLIYAISDRRSLDVDLPTYVARAVAAGVDMFQVREKDLTDRELYELMKRCVGAVSGSMKMLVNDRLDIAVAARADGVHLGGHSAPVKTVRKHAPPGFLIGVSTHNLAEAQKAEDGGADFITFGPVFYTASKAKYGPPVGVPALTDILAQVHVPVFALGGINRGNLAELAHLPVAGISGISMFQAADDLAQTVTGIRRLRD